MEQLSSQKQARMFYCPNFHHAQLLCFSEKCSANALVCRDSTCSHFQDNHRTCKFTRLEGLIKSIQMKKTKMDPQLGSIFQNIDKTYLECLQRLSQDREKMLDFKDNYGLSHNQKKLLESLKSNCTQNLTGRLVSSLKNNISTFQNDLHWMTEKWYGTFVQHKQKLFGDFFSRIQRVFNQDISLPNIDSKILNEGNIDYFIRLFKRPIKKLKLLYRASQNSYSIKKFHQQCDGIKDNVLLVRTGHDKVIGGYTPLPWGVGYGWIRDQSYETFLFSLSLLAQFYLKKDEQAIGISPQWGPVFGQNDLCIGKSALLSSSSWSQFPLSFQCTEKHYQREDFVDGKNFRIKQWEVFQIQWDV